MNIHPLASQISFMQHLSRPFQSPVYHWMHVQYSNWETLIWLVLLLGWNCVTGQCDTFNGNKERGPALWLQEKVQWSILMAEVRQTNVPRATLEGQTFPLSSTCLIVQTGDNGSSTFKKNHKTIVLSHYVHCKKGKIKYKSKKIYARHML